MEWPRIPLPGWPDGKAEGAAEELARSAARGRDLAALLDPDTPVPGVTLAPLRPEIACIAVPATTGGRNMAGEDFAVTAGWGHYGQGDAVMPGQGRAAERAVSPDERAALGDALPTLGERTLDIYLNGEAFWRNVPAAIWTYRLGGYQVLKKWLSYRERGILGRPLKPEEVQHFTDTARRIGAILSMTVGRIVVDTTAPTVTPDQTCRSLPDGRKRRSAVKGWGWWKDRVSFRRKAWARSRAVRRSQRFSRWPRP